MPRSHPYPFVYARPRFIPGRGFTGLGRRRRYGMGQTATTAGGTTSGGGNALSCNVFNTPGCSILDAIWHESDECATALQLCMNPGSGLNIPGTPPSAGSITTPELIAQTQNPTGSNVAPDAAAALKAYQAAVAAANQCPAGTFAADNGACCPNGFTANSDGSCTAPGGGWPWWAIPAAIGAVVLVVALK